MDAELDEVSATKIVIQVLLGVPAVVALVGDRITNPPLPREFVLPAITVDLISDVEDYTLAGASGYPESRVSVVCIAENASIADDIAEAVRAGIKDFSGTVAGFQAIIMKEGGDFYDYVENQPIHRRIVDFMVRWRAA